MFKSFIFFFKFIEKYGYIFDRNNLPSIGEVENIRITFDSAVRYANFSVNLFHISSRKSEDKEKARHELRLYCFWSFDPDTNIPNETVFFYKMIKVINENNPKVLQMIANNKLLKNKKIFKNIANMDAISNYIIHSE
jgi:hypothetical protein